ncbi:MAG: hypothetical protein GXO23_03790 [Crenarchaeota archaeon]|nr:hypothetical protein [Thermoproteota archaeon]
MRKILTILAYVRGVELVLLYLILESFLFLLYARLILAIQFVEVILILTVILIHQITPEKGKLLLLVTSSVCLITDIGLLSVLITSGLRILTAYIAFTSNILIDTVLTLLSIELVRRE